MMMRWWLIILSRLRRDVCCDVVCSLRLDVLLEVHGCLHHKHPPILGPLTLAILYEKLGFSYWSLR